MSLIPRFITTKNNSKDGKNYSLKEEKDSLEECQNTFNKSEIHIVKKKLLPHIESIIEGMEAASEIQRNMGNELDPQNEQEKIECAEIGIEENPDYAVRDYDGMFETDDAVKGSKVRLNFCYKFLSSHLFDVYGRSDVRTRGTV